MSHRIPSRHSRAVGRRAGCDRSTDLPPSPPRSPAVAPKRPRHPPSPRRASRAASGWPGDWRSRCADPGVPRLHQGALDRSPVAEHKLHFQRILAADRREAPSRHGRGREAKPSPRRRPMPTPLRRPRAVLPRSRAPGGLVAAASDISSPPAREDARSAGGVRRAWRRRVLSPDASRRRRRCSRGSGETDFDRPIRHGAVHLLRRRPRGAGGGGRRASTSTASHFAGKFEGWLKGSPEYEIHILGQSGTSDSLTSYQCAGEHAAGALRVRPEHSRLDRQRDAVQSAPARQRTRASTPTRTSACSPSRTTTAPVHPAGQRPVQEPQTTLQTHYPNLTGGKDSARRARKIQARQRAAGDPQGGLFVAHLAGRSDRQRHRGRRRRRISRRRQLDRPRQGNITNGWLKLRCGDVNSGGAGCFRPSSRCSSAASPRPRHNGPSQRRSSPRDSGEGHARLPEAVHFVLTDRHILGAGVERTWGRAASQFGHTTPTKPRARRY